MRQILVDPVLDAQFQKFGWVVVPFLSPEDVETITSIYEANGPAPGDPELAIYFDYQSDSPEYKRMVSETARPLFEARSAAILSDYELFYPEFIMKWPGYRSGFPPHQDVTFVDEDEHRTVSIWCPMVDVTGEGEGDTGLICMLPGSHRLVDWPQAWNPDFPFAGLETEIIEQFSVGVPVKAGQGLVFDHRIVHFSLPNGNPAPRLVMDGNFRPRGAQMYHYRQTGDDGFDLYAIDNSFFFNTNPPLLSQGPPDPGAFVRHLDKVRPEITVADLEQLASDVGLPDSGDIVVDLAARLADGDPYWYSMSNSAWRVQAVPFCDTCGTEDDLHQAGTVGYGHAVMRCRSCDPVWASQNPEALPAPAPAEEPEAEAEPVLVGSPVSNSPVSNSPVVAATPAAPTSRWRRLVSRRG